jgi:hypothetical protein
MLYSAAAGYSWIQSVSLGTVVPILVGFDIGLLIWIRRLIWRWTTSKCKAKCLWLHPKIGFKNWRLNVHNWTWHGFMNCHPIASFLVVCKNNRPQCAAGHKAVRKMCSTNVLAPTVYLPHCNFDTRAKDHTLTKGSYSSAVALLREPKKRDSRSCNLEIHATYRSWLVLKHGLNTFFEPPCAHLHTGAYYFCTWPKMKLWGGSSWRHVEFS